MEFWGVEVKPGQSLKVKPELYKLIHVSQAALDEVKDVNEAKSVPVRVTVGGNSFVIGTLSAEDRPQLMFDLVFEKEFELSHGWKNGSVYFIGYMADDQNIEEFESQSDEEDEEDEENVLDASVMQKLEAKKAEVNHAKKTEAFKTASSMKANVTKAVPKEESEDDDDSEDDSEDSDDSEDDDDSIDVPAGMNSDGPEGMDFSDDDDEDDDDDDSSEDDDSEEETPQKVEQSKKRPAPATKGAPGSAKKAKQATPDKTGGKKGPATPFAKPNGKPNAIGNNGKGQTPKSGGQFSGKSSNKNFGGQQKNFKGKQGKK